MKGNLRQVMPIARLRVCVRALSCVIMLVTRSACMNMNILLSAGPTCININMSGHTILVAPDRSCDRQVRPALRSPLCARAFSRVRVRTCVRLCAIFARLRHAQHCYRVESVRRRGTFSGILVGSGLGNGRGTFRSARRRGTRWKGRGTFRNTACLVILVPRRRELRRSSRRGGSGLRRRRRCHRTAVLQQCGGIGC